MSIEEAIGRTLNTLLALFVIQALFCGWESLIRLNMYEQISKNATRPTIIVEHKWDETITTRKVVRFQSRLKTKKKYNLSINTGDKEVIIKVPKRDYKAVNEGRAYVAYKYGDTYALSLESLAEPIYPCVMNVLKKIILGLRVSMAGLMVILITNLIEEKRLNKAKKKRTT